MSEKASYFKIGLFVMVSIALLVTAIVILGSGLFERKSILFETYIDGSITGLDVGSPVKLRGVKVGQVKEIAFVDDVYTTEARYVLVRASLESPQSRPIRRSDIRKRYEKAIEEGLRIRIASQGLTGTSYLDADYIDSERFPPMKVPWTPTTLYIPSVPSILASLSDSLTSLLDKLDKAEIDQLAHNIDALVVSLNGLANQEIAPMLREVKQTVSNLSQSLHGVSVSVQDAIQQDLKPILQNAEAATRSLPDTMSKLNQTIERVDSILKNEAGKIDASLANIQKITENLQRVDNIPESLVHFNRTLGRVDTLIESQQDGVAEVVQNLRDVTRDLNELAEQAKKHPSGILFGEPPPPQKGGR